MEVRLAVEELVRVLDDVLKRNVGLVAFSRHNGMISGIAFSGDGQHVASAGWDGEVCVWAVE